MPVVARDVLKGLGDTLENLLSFTALSLAWWLAAFLIVPMPGATIALFSATDPRLIHTTERPGARDGIGLTEHFLLRGWMTVVIGVPLLGVAGFNLWSFRNETDVQTALIPLWVAVMVSVAGLATLTLSCIALFDDTLRFGLRRAVGIFVTRPLAIVLVLAALWVLLVLCTALVVPLFMFYPALAAAVVNRFVLRTLGFALPDPLEPSFERYIEDERARSARRFGP